MKDTVYFIVISLIMVVMAYFVAFGCEKLIHLTSQNGTGKRTSLQVHVPAGIDDGQSIRLKGKGMPGVGGGEAGDLFLKVHVGARPGFERKGMDVYTSAEIPFTTAVFGGETRVQTLNGSVICKIPAGCQCGSKIRLKGKGVPSLRNKNIRGDQYVTLVVQTPTNLNEEAKKALEAFDAACGNRPSEDSTSETSEKNEKKKKGFREKVKEMFEE